MRFAPWTAVAVAVCAFLPTLAACSPSDRDPPVTPFPSATLKTETAQEREERLAYESAEKSYRAVRAEFRRVTAAGGSNSATSVMKANAGGPYLAELTKAIKAYKDTGYRSGGQEVIGYVRPNGYSTSSLLIDVCEDDSKVYAIDKHGRRVASPDILQLELDVHRVDGAWKVWSGRGQKVQSCS